MAKRIEAVRELINDNMASGMLNKIVSYTATPLVDLARNMIIQS